MKRWIAAVAPWIGLAVLAWRQQTLERAVSDFVGAAQRVLGARAAVAAEDIPIPGEETLHGGSGPVWN